MVGRALPVLLLFLAATLAGCGAETPPLAIEQVRLFNDLCRDGIEVSFSVRNLSPHAITGAHATAKRTSAESGHTFPSYDLEPNQTRTFRTTLPFDDNCLLDQPVHVQITASAPGRPTARHESSLRT